MWYLMWLGYRTWFAYAGTCEHNAQQLGHMSVYSLITKGPCQRAARDQNVEPLFCYDIGLGLSMQAHVGTSRSNLANLVFHHLITKGPCQRAAGDQHVESQLAMILDSV